MILQIIPYICFLPILGYLGYIDVKTHEIPNKVIYPGAVLAIILNLLLSDISWHFILLGGLLSFLFAVILNTFTSIGAGDIKFFMMVGFMFGFPMFLGVILGAFLLGGVMVAVFSLASKIDIKGNAPFGVFMAASGIIVSGWLIFYISTIYPRLNIW